MHELRTISLITTFQCTSACEHCCFNCNPQNQDKMNQELMFRSIDQAAKVATVKSIVFTGGECFLLGDLLYKGISRASNYGLSTRCVSNASWAKDVKSADRVVALLKRAGLKEINFSTGDHHLRYVSLECVKNAVMSSIKHNIRTVVNVETFKNSNRICDVISLLQPMADNNKRLTIKYGIWVSNGGKTIIEHDEALQLKARKQYHGCQYNPEHNECLAKWRCCFVLWSHHKKRQ